MNIDVLDADSLSQFVINAQDAYRKAHPPTMLVQLTRDERRQIYRDLIGCQMSDAYIDALDQKFNEATTE